MGAGQASGAVGCGISNTNVNMCFMSHALVYMRWNLAGVSCHAQLSCMSMAGEEAILVSASL